MTEALPRIGRGAALATAGLGANAVALAVFVHKGIVWALLFALLPAIVLAFGRLLDGGGLPLLVVALALPMSWSRLTTPLPIGGGHLYPTDLVVLVALGAFAFSRARPPERRGQMRWPDSPLLGRPLILFALIVLFGLVRGHFRYGQTLLGQPTRLFLYAGIGVLLGGLDARRVHRTVTAVFYTGAVWMMLNGARYVATGTSQTDQEDLSTGGTRVLAISTSIYLASTFFLALLNLQLAKTARRRLLHLAVAVLSFVGMLLGFGRAVFIATALVATLLLVLNRRVRLSLLAPLPLALPALLLAGLIAVKAAPQVEKAIVERVTKPVSNDANVQWRVKANDAVLQQVRQSPLIGVGFGRGSSFTLMTQSSDGLPVPIRMTIDQDPHDGYLMLLAAGGILLLGSFLLLLVRAFHDGWQRFRGSVDPHERIVILWALGTAFVFLFNAASGTELEAGPDLLTMWTMLLLPSVVPRRLQASRQRRRAADGPGRKSAPTSSLGHSR